MSRRTAASPTKSAPRRIPPSSWAGSSGPTWAPASTCRHSPNFEWTQVPESHRHVSKVVEECNWLQALEGGIDTSHAPILHRDHLSPPPPGQGSRCSGPFVRGKAPTLEVDVTDYGYRYAGVRPLEDGQTYVRTLSLHHALYADPAATIPLSQSERRQAQDRGALLGADG